MSNRLRAQIPSAGAVAVNPIAQKSGIVQGGGTTLTYTWPVPLTAASGKKAIVMVTAYGPPASIAVSDSGGNVYTQRIAPVGDSQVAHYDADITAGVSSTTITFPAGTDASAVFTEVVGLVPSTAYDTNGEAQGGLGSAPHVLTPAGTLAQASELQFTSIGGNGGPGPITLTQPTGFTLLAAELTNAFIQHASAYRVISTTTPGSSQWTSSTPLAADYLVAYKLASSSSWDSNALWDANTYWTS